MGYCRSSGMISNYVDTNLLMDTLLGIRYVLTDEAPLAYRKQENENLPEGISIYENEKALSFGTVIDKEAANFKWSDDNNIFSNQQKFVKMITGDEESERILVKQKYEERFEKGKRIWEVTAVSDGPIYCYWRAGHEDSSAYVNGEFKQPYFSKFYKNVIYLGDYKKGDKVSVSIDDNKNCPIEHGFEAYAFNMPLFNETIDNLKENSLQQTDIKGSTLTGKISTEKDGVLWLSVPYDESWSIRLNGKKAEYKQILNCFIGIDVEAGEYELVMKYISPNVVGALLVSVISFVVFIIWNKKGRIKRIGE